jgi:hypothetical protein
MWRGRTARTLLSLVAAVLLALQVFAPSEAFASAHRGEIISCAEAECPEKTAPALRVRDRSRDEDLLPQPSARHLLGSDPASAHPLVSPVGSPREPRAPASLSPAVLQVFRC